MSDFEKCRQDLNRWGVHYKTGSFYDGYIETGIWICIGGEHGQYLVFTPEGEFTDLGNYII